ncbi:DinB family protein [Streptomyces somaliensis DSM 40738]|uniref:DinB family protein n=1 Tax=Streptomyces somaliensis (strain ATCC 33201 / DSM 40738 / JCM 12659 / KCTC 9044 / NCTC 11332 / NRRL B-12077 / IP 733) TaxID=1134445 RepID=A0AA44IF24_STRE0|nr:DinB family protein [Streptomyces somaliensis]MCQ0022560.1 DinB family protein [Streptomyces somaliensis DSM 40738]NKY16359.1 DinB family protein [Streptomyces somaliensis DSM 40738]
MFAAPDGDPRVDVPLPGDERTVLTGFLRWQRQTLVVKCSGLGPEALARRPVDFSGLSPLGLVRHMAEVERRWFRQRMAGHETAPHFGTGDGPDAAFDGAVADADAVAEAWRTWREEVDFAERHVAEAADLDVTGTDPWRGPVTLRWVLVRMAEEYARHNGHADFLRQEIDGAVGQ